MLAANISDFPPKKWVDTEVAVTRPVCYFSAAVQRGAVIPQVVGSIPSTGRTCDTVFCCCHPPSPSGNLALGMTRKHEKVFFFGGTFFIESWSKKGR